MNFHPKIKSALATLLGCSIALQPIIAQAAVHPMSAVKTDSTTLQTIDLAANVDFDFDASPAVVANGLTLNRAYVESVLKSTAQTLFSMTEGRHRIGSVFVYRNNRFGNNVDIKIIGLIGGRSNAHGSGLGKTGRTSNNYTAFPDSPTDTAEGLGKTIAHEMGHYIYGLFDEYREEGRAFNPNSITSPADDDTPLSTLMHNQAEFGGFSTPADYTATTKTAHGRAYSASAWEVLARDPDKDPEVIKNRGRTSYPAFAGFVPKNQGSLTKPVAGFDAAFKVVFMPDPTVVEQFVISRAVTLAQLAAIKNAVQQSIQRLPLGANIYVGINTSPGDVLIKMATFETEAARKAALDAVEALTVDSTSPDFPTAASNAVGNIEALYSTNAIVRGASTALNVFSNANESYFTSTFNRLRESNTALNGNIITGAPGASSSNAKRAVAVEDLAKSAMRAKAATSAPTMTLAQIAHATGGHYNDAHRASELTVGAAKAVSASSGISEATLATQFVTGIAAGGSFAMKSSVLAKNDGKLNFTASWENQSDNANIRYELTAPDGTRYAPNNVLAKQTLGVNNDVKYEFDADSNTAYFEVAKSYTGRAGDWTSTVVALAAINAPIDQVSAAESTLRAETDVLLDGSPNPILTFELASDRAVLGATVTALFYGADGELKLTKVLLDDGTGGDIVPGDGTYSVAVGGLLPPGQYDVVVNAGAGPSGAVFSSAGATVKGVNQPPEPVGGKFSRTIDTLLSVSATTVVEYYVPSLKKYFITARDSDKTLLAQNPGTFSLTGMSFVAQLGSAPPAGTQPICRYYFSPPLANTHFYGTPADCTAIAKAYAGNASAKNEGIDFAITVPDAAGNCPAAAPVKVYRSFNNRSAQNDGNHRYTVSTARYDLMAAAGYSRDGAVFCAASATDAQQ